MRSFLKLTISPNMNINYTRTDFFTWWNMHEILDKLKIRTVQFLVKFLLENRREIEFEAKMIRILSLFKIFELKKVSLSRILTRDRFSSRNLTKKLNGSNFQLSQNVMHIPSRDKSSFNDFLSYLKISPVFVIPILVKLSVKNCRKNL